MAGRMGLHPSGFYHGCRMRSGAIRQQDPDPIDAGQRTSAILQKLIFLFPPVPTDCRRLWLLGSYICALREATLILSVWDNRSLHLKEAWG